MKGTQRTLFIILALVAVGVAAVLLWRYFETAPSTAQAADLDWYIHKAKQWELQARILRAAQVTLAALAIIASVMSAAQWKPASIPNGFLAVLAAVSIALLTGLDLTTQANKIRNAERHLTFSILDFKQKPGAPLDNLLKAYQEAENLVGDYSPQIGTK
jgi:archaellum biogenesis protein FlaJ (TadC family)